MLISIQTRSIELNLNTKKYSYINESIEIIKEYELYKQKPYTLFGKKYVGYGHLTNNNDHLTELQADSLLRKDYFSNYSQLDTSISERYKVLLTMLAYNIGITKVKKSKLYKLVINKHGNTEIYKEYIRYKYISETIHAKLLERRIKEFRVINVLL